MSILIAQNYFTRAYNSRLLLVGFTLCLSFLLSGACSEKPETLFKRLEQDANAYFLRGDYDNALRTWKKREAVS